MVYRRRGYQESDNGKIKNNQNLREAKETFLPMIIFIKGSRFTYYLRKVLEYFFVGTSHVKLDYFAVIYMGSGIKPEKGFKEDQQSWFCPALSKGLKGRGWPSV